jgi:hypothetical protein
MEGLALTRIADGELGRGRCAVVLRGVAADGRTQARKIFTPGSLTGLILRTFTGAPNPYVWNEHAVQCAVLRRRVLQPLVEFWLPGLVRVVPAEGYCWNPAFRAFEMGCELVRGRHLALLQPLSEPAGDQLAELVHRVMKPLQGRLQEAGFHGQVWQAGRGNPVASGNFLYEAPRGHAGGCWAWIDLESGVPAVFPANPFDLVRYYLPQSFRCGRALFDDVDAATVRRYIRSCRPQMEACLGRDRVDVLARDIEALAGCQHLWKSQPWLERSIRYRQARGDIDARQAEWHLRHPWGWWVLEIGRFMCATLRAGARLARRIIARLARIRLQAVIRAVWAFISSQAYRLQVARFYVDARIGQWEKRGQLDGAEAEQLRSQLQAAESSAYLADFGVHLMIKPVVKTLQWWVMPGLWVLGVIDSFTLGVFLLVAGAAARTAYTMFRVVQNHLHGREKPWVALGAGFLPMVGNLAFPIQIIASGVHRQELVAQFLLYDGLSRLGQLVPVWGGPDTLTEHWLNRCADRIVQWGRARRRRAAPQESRA